MLAGRLTGLPMASWNAHGSTELRLRVVADGRRRLAVCPVAGDGADALAVRPVGVDGRACNAPAP